MCSMNFWKVPPSVGFQVSESICCWVYPAFCSRPAL